MRVQSRVLLHRGARDGVEIHGSAGGDTTETALPAENRVPLRSLPVRQSCPFNSLPVHQCPSVFPANPGS